MLDQISVSAFRPMTFWEKVRGLFGKTQPMQTLPIGVASYQFTGIVKPAKKDIVPGPGDEYLYDADGREFKWVSPGW